MSVHCDRIKKWTEFNYQSYILDKIMKALKYTINLENLILINIILI